MNKWLSKILLKYYFRHPESYYISLGSHNQKGSLLAAVNMLPLWEAENYAKKLRAILTFRWKPEENQIYNKAIEVFQKDIFGKPEDYGHMLYNTQLIHHERTWDLSSLTPEDEQKIEALMGAKILTMQRHSSKGTSDLLKLQLPSYNLMMCSLVVPMIAKIPVISIRYCLEIQENFAFSSIRSANHPYADELVAYVYETLLIQQKLASCFHQLLGYMEDIKLKKADAKLTSYEMNAISTCDGIINYLKATIEKTILILAFTFEVINLETYKKHQQKLKALDAKLPAKAKDQPYFQFIWHYIQPEELEKLNNLRTGVNHKKGITSLQAHSYLDKGLVDTPLAGQFDILLNQHRLNTAILLGVLALLTDDLIFRQPITEMDRSYMQEAIDMHLSVIENEMAYKRSREKDVSPKS